MGKESWAKTWQWERANPRGSPRADGQAWNWLIHLSWGLLKLVMIVYNAPVKRTEHFDWTTLNICSAKSVLFSDVQLLGDQTYWTFCWTRLNFALTITHCARANWTNVQWLVKRTEQHSTSRKTKEMLSCSSFVQWKVWSWLNWTRLNKGGQGSTRWSNALNILHSKNVQCCSVKCSVRLTGA